ncbi:hypothetical protein Tco_1131802 [Tanacetum coccineum]|uniref:Uncharacterized protein n=1 Tax=Tanacetum coccineum TaxID=301880 RepID=A0ABQ5JAS7_9ASTR
MDVADNISLDFWSQKLPKSSQGYDTIWVRLWVQFGYEFGISSAYDGTKPTENNSTLEDMLRACNDRPLGHGFALERVVRFGKRGKLNPRFVGPFKPFRWMGLLFDDHVQFIVETIELIDREVKLGLKRSVIPLVLRFQMELQEGSRVYMEPKFNS